MGERANELAAAVRSGLRKAAKPEDAPAMQAYMKSAMPYLGVHTPPMRAICKEAFAAHPLPDADSWLEAVLKLWREAAFREERYAAIELAGARAYRAFRTPDTLAAWEEMIVSGAWWDYVDSIAGGVISDLLRRYPGELKPVMRSWSRSDSLWKRRVSIIAQISFKKDTDLELLYGCIEVNLDDREFFIRKAIGWALRAYAWTDPIEVSHYVEAHADRLSGLSKREALKNVEKLLSVRPAVPAGSS